MDRVNLRRGSALLAHVALLSALLVTTLAIAGSPTSASAGRKVVPDSIDASGTQDVSGALNAFVSSAPNGSTIVFKAGGTYRLGGVLRVVGKRGITIEGNGATLKLTGPGGLDGAGIIIEGQSQDTTVRNLAIVGNHDAAGTSSACCSREGQHAIAVYGSTNTLVEKVDIRRVGGDCFYVGLHDARVWSDGVTFRDSTCRLVGRHGLTIEGGRNVRLVNNVFDQLGFMFVDIEPGTSNEGAIDVVIRDNTDQELRGHRQLRPLLLRGLRRPLGRRLDRARRDGHRQHRRGQPLGLARREALGLQSMVCGDNATRADFTFADNVAKGTVDGARWGVMRFKTSSGVTVTGNSQPRSGGSVLATFPGSTDVTYRP